MHLRKIAFVAAVVGACGGPSPSGPPVGIITPGDSTPVTPVTPVTPASLPPLGFSSRTISEGSAQIPYTIFAPQNFNRSQKWPVIVALAGSVERGTDGVAQVGVGLGPVVKANPNFGAIVIFPQIPATEDGRLLFTRLLSPAIDAVIKEYSGDVDRVYLTGLSFGGTEGWDLLYQSPTRFAAFVGIAPGVCGRCISPSVTLPRDSVFNLLANRLKAVPIWLFQGDQDPNVSVLDTRLIVSDFRKAGSNILYTEFGGAGHEIWDRVYADPKLWTWLFAQRR